MQTMKLSFKKRIKKNIANSKQKNLSMKSSRQAKKIVKRSLSDPPTRMRQDNIFHLEIMKVKVIHQFDPISPAKPSKLLLSIIANKIIL
jgi:hypothetical protein